ncbi:MAG: HEAT repeat domain-containing protein [Candidatus Heimdallarchaeaceae archaeon]
MKSDTDLKKFHNLTDRQKLAFLMEIEIRAKEEQNIPFLFNVIEKESYEKIRIKALLVLRKYLDAEIAKKIRELYAYERENSVKLAMIEVLGDYNDQENADFLISIIKKDQNDVIRSTALRKLYEKQKNVDKTKLKSVILAVIKNDKDSFPKQIALAIAQNYPEDDVYKTIREVFLEEKWFQMKSLLYKTLEKIANKQGREIDVEEPVEEELKNDKKRKKKKKRRRKDSLLLFF